MYIKKPPGFMASNVCANILIKEFSYEKIDKESVFRAGFVRSRNHVLRRLFKKISDEWKRPRKGALVHRIGSWF